MSKLSLKLCGAASALALVAAVAVPAISATPIPLNYFLYAGGATFPELIYRDFGNCWGNTSGGETAIGLPAAAYCTTKTSYTTEAQVLYAGVGSGNGRRALRNHIAGNPGGLTNGGRVPDNTPVPATVDSGSFYNSMGETGQDWWDNWAANGADAPAFPTISFIGSDAILTTSEYTAAGNYLDHSDDAGNNWGPMIQVPALIGAIGLGFTPNAGWVLAGKKPTSPVGTYSLLSLTTDTWCGIMTGAINSWDDSEITDDNGGVALPAEPIYIVVRGDGSGSTEIFANALINQCAASAHPVPADWQTAAGNSAGKSNDSWFIHVRDDDGDGTPLPTHFPLGNDMTSTPGFIFKSGNGGIQSFVAGTPDAIGYMSSDFLQPASSTGPLSANLQTWASFLNGDIPKKAKYKQPNWKSAGAIMAGKTPPSDSAGSCTTDMSYNPGTSPDGVCSHNPVNWSVTEPLPTSALAYPIGGFTFFEMYSCYNPAGDTNVSALFGNKGGHIAPLQKNKSGFFHYWYVKGKGKSKQVLKAATFGQLPATWLTAVSNLLFTDTATRPGIPGQAGTACSGLAAVDGA